MNEHEEEVSVMLMLRREQACRTGALRVVRKVHTDPGLPVWGTARGFGISRRYPQIRGALQSIEAIAFNHCIVQFVVSHRS